MIDSHSHIYCDAFDEDRDAVVQRAREAGVRHIILPNENLESVPRLAAMCEQYPDYISMALGVHPEDVHEDYLDVLCKMRPLLDQYPVVAVGEIGIDLYWDKTYREQQRHALDIQLHWCHELGLPFIIHCRESLDDILDVIDNLDCPVPQLLPAIGLDRLLLETDAPFLTPVPHRGKRNESAYIPHINDFIARSLGVTPEEVSEATDRNAVRLFHLEL